MKLGSGMTYVTNATSEQIKAGTALARARITFCRTWVHHTGVAYVIVWKYLRLPFSTLINKRRTPVPFVNDAIVISKLGNIPFFIGWVATSELSVPVLVKRTNKYGNPVSRDSHSIRHSQMCIFEYRSTS